jgi:hypothetical protein
VLVRLVDHAPVVVADEQTPDAADRLAAPVPSLAGETRHELSSNKVRVWSC